METEQVQIRDLRNKFYQVDNELFTVYAAEIGINAFAVYNALACMANTDQKCFPGMQHLADKLGVSRPVILQAIKKLEENGLIHVERERGFQHLYTLLQVSKDTCKQNSQGGVKNLDRGCKESSQGGVKNLDTNNTNTTIPNQQDGPRVSILKEEVLKDYFVKIVTVLKQPDLEPTSNNLYYIQLALNDHNIANIENILKACTNIMRSDSPPGWKRFAYLFNKWDYSERIDEWMKWRPSGQQEIKKYVPTKKCKLDITDGDGVIRSYYDIDGIEKSYDQASAKSQS